MLRKLLLAGACLMPAVAAAQPVQGLYIGAGVGANFAGTLSSSRDHIDTNPGPVGLAAAGWGFGNGLRVEFEGIYRTNGVNNISTLRADGLTLPTSNVSGRAATYAVMANAVYDIPFHPFGLPLTPYVGAGVGYGWLDFPNAGGNEPVILHLSSGNTYTGPGAISYGSGGAFAYQAIVGTSLAIAPVPGLSVTLEYRFFGMAQATVSRNLVATNGNTINGVTPSTQGHAGFQVFDNAVLIGLRYNFGVAPAPAIAPAAVPAPAVAAARSYLVFFDWDKATLTDRARQIVAEAAANSTRVQYTRIEVNGYTDTSGTPQYNQGLSVRRAQAVAAELVKDGVPTAAIAIQGFGETHLLVPTGPGVREPQNRRVEIVIR
jgi:outer membrane protein OmpA-like peptidoglycan-associated protein